MVIEPKETTIAYRCPHCGAGVMSVVGVFTLSADMFKLKCACKKSEMTVQYSKDDKIRLTVPCILCPKPHNYTLSTSLFYKQDIFMLQCPYSDMNICFIGELNHVKAELARSEYELLKLMEENGIDDYHKLHPEEDTGGRNEFLSDKTVTDIIKYVIHDLESESKIHCYCDEEVSPGEYDVEVLDDAVRVFCKKCGAMKVIPTDSLSAAQAFFETEFLYLT